MQNQPDQPVADDDPEDVFARQLEKDLLEGKSAGKVAQAHLDAGSPVYYTEPGTPRDHMIKELPDRRRFLVRDDKGKDVIIREIEPR